MPLNISKGNMFPFVSHTWNTVKGKCPHDCSYCYMKQFQQNDMRFDEKELETDLGGGLYIFVGSSCDLWADDVPWDCISKTLAHCRDYKNKYLFQTKNPKRYQAFTELFPPDTVLGTTLESNRVFPEMGKAPTPTDRVTEMIWIGKNFQTTVTVEPVMDFDPMEFWNMICICDPKWVSIGADSKGHGLPEPTSDKLEELIENLEQVGIEVKLKDNLKRLI